MLLVIFVSAAVDAALNNRVSKGSLMDPELPPILSLCMIVRNESGRLGEMLSHHASLVDEIVVVDTGSEDDTPEIAREHGARLKSFAWNDDFSAARNVSLDAARGRWILVLDADEWIDERDFSKIRVATAASATAQAFTMETHTYTNDASLIDWQPAPDPPARARDFSGYYSSSKVRLFPNLPEIRFRGIIHELVEPTIREADIPIIDDLGVAVHHLPASQDNPERAKRKREYYLVLSRRKAAENLNDAKAQMELGNIAFESGYFSEAADALARAAEINPEDESILTLCGAARIRAGDFAAAHDILLSAQNQFPRSAVVHTLLGEVFQHGNDTKSAEHHFLTALSIQPNFPHLLILLGNLYMVTGRSEQALACFSHAADINPQSEIAQTNAGIVLASMSKIDESKDRFEAARKLNPKVWLAWFYLGQIAEVQGRREEARYLYEKALSLSPSNRRIQEALERT